MGGNGSWKRLIWVKAWIAGKGALAAARLSGDETSWRRERKLPLYDMLVSIMGRKCLTTRMEIRRYFREARKAEKEVSTQDYLTRRKKLNGEVFRVLNEGYLKRFYESGEEAAVWRGYVVLAIDGSRAEVPNSKENRGRFGVIENQYGDAVARCNISGMYDVLNEFYLDLSIHHYKVNEIEEAKGQIRRMRGITGKRRVLIIFDRGYPSLEFIDFLEKEGIKYLIRLKEGIYRKEREELGGKGGEIELAHTKDRLRTLKGKDEERAAELAAKGKTKARIVQGTKLGGKELSLITNLEEVYTAGQIRTLYRKRWEIEKRYHTLKNKMKFESVTGKASVYVYQDFYAQIFVYNMVHDLMKDAALKLAEKRHDNKYKYEMRINENRAIGLFKESFIHLMTLPDKAGREALFDETVEAIKRNLVPVRKCKTAPRRWHYFNKYKCNQKPSF
jgi:hypothetical protein